MALYLLIVSLCGLYAQWVQYDSDYLKGKAQGKLDGSAGNSCLWNGVGCCLGPFALIPALAAPASQPPAIVMMSLKGKSESYKTGYLKGYQEGSRNKVLRSTLLGSGITTAILLAVWYYSYLY